MKIIFLDIDGVLNTCANPTHKVRHFDATSVEFVRDLIEKGCKVVVSSVWRKSSSYLEMSQLLHVAGLGRGVLHKDWRTPGGGKVRGDEIKSWLKDHPNVESYVIFDDDSDMLPEQLDNFVQTDHFTGVTFREWCKACHILGFEDYGRKDHPTIVELMKELKDLKKAYDEVVRERDELKGLMQ